MYHFNCSIFKKGLEFSGLSLKLATASGSSFTVLAPIDQAFGRMDKYEFDNIFDDEKLVQKVIHHIKMYKNEPPRGKTNNVVSEQV